MPNSFAYDVRLCFLAALALMAKASPANAGDREFEDYFGAYFERIEGVTPGSGDAKEVNAASQIVTPWPHRVWDRRIPANGPRMSGAIQRYQDVRKLKETATPLSPEPINPSGFASGSAGR